MCMCAPRHATISFWNESAAAEVEFYFTVSGYRKSQLPQIE